MMKLKGRVYKLHRILDNVSCNNIISDKHKLSSQAFEGIEPEFVHSVSKDDFLVAGYNFGCGSTNEQAPQTLIKLGVKAVIAKSFSWTFYRNSFNQGLLLVECNTDYIDDKDELEIDCMNMFIRNQTKKTGIKINEIEPEILRIYMDGGLIPHLKKNNNKYNLTLHHTQDFTRLY